MYRYKKSVPVDYDTQAYIYYKSLMYRKLPKKDRELIGRLCEAAGGEHAAALLDFVTTKKDATYICREHYISRSTLERVVRKYYVAYARIL